MAFFYCDSTAFIASLVIRMHPPHSAPRDQVVLPVAGHHYPELVWPHRRGSGRYPNPEQGPRLPTSSPQVGVVMQGAMRPPLCATHIRSNWDAFWLFITFLQQRPLHAGQCDKSDLLAKVQHKVNLFWFFKQIWPFSLPPNELAVRSNGLPPVSLAVRNWLVLLSNAVA
jgi:hypothetical protein